MRSFLMLVMMRFRTTGAILVLIVLGTFSRIAFKFAKILFLFGVVLDPFDSLSKLDAQIIPTCMPYQGAKLLRAL